jgi:hypothetical protein
MSLWAAGLVLVKGNGGDEVHGALKDSVAEFFSLFFGI